MITATVLSLTIATFLVLTAIEPFHRGVKKWMNVLRFYLRRLRINQRTLRKLPKTVSKAWPVLRQKRAFKLFKLKLLKNYYQHKQKPASN